MNTPPLTKRDAIIEKAAELFQSKGYSATSMDAIAEAVPVSKATLYSYFQDKKTLFSFAVSACCERMSRALKDSLTVDKGLQETLYGFALAYLEIVYAPSNLRACRLIMGECIHFPEIGLVFQESGPRVVAKLLQDFLTHASTEKRLHLTDPALTTRLFMSTLKGERYMECMLGISPGPSAEEREYLAQEVVSLFVKGYQQ